MLPRVPGQLRVVRPPGAAAGQPPCVPVLRLAGPRAVVPAAGGHAVDDRELRGGRKARAAARAVVDVRVRRPQHGRPDRQAVRRRLSGTRREVRDVGHRGPGGHGPRGGRVERAPRSGRAAEARGPRVGGRRRCARVHPRGGGGPHQAQDVRRADGRVRGNADGPVPAAGALARQTRAGQRPAAQGHVPRVVLGRPAPGSGAQHPVPDAADHRDRQRRVLQRRVRPVHTPVPVQSEHPDRPRQRQPRRAPEPSAQGCAVHQSIPRPGPAAASR